MEKNKSAVSLLKYMLEDIRKITLEGIEGLTKEQLFRPPLEGEFPIGSYLMHMAEVDIYWYSAASGVPMHEDLMKRAYYDNWYDSSQENPLPPAQPLEIEEYLSVLADSRKVVLDYLDTLTDENLEEKVERQRRGGGKEYISKKWIMYHLVEHEAHHRGQMFMLIRKSGMKKEGENNDNIL